MNKKNLPSGCGIFAILLIFAMGWQMWDMQIPQGYYFTWMNGVFGAAAAPILYICAVTGFMGSMYLLGFAVATYDNWRDR